MMDTWVKTDNQSTMTSFLSGKKDYLGPVLSGGYYYACLRTDEVPATTGLTVISEKDGKAILGVWAEKHVQFPHHGVNYSNMSGAYKYIQYIPAIDEVEVKSFSDAGMSVVRFAVCWRYLQPTMGGALDAAALQILKREVGKVTDNGMAAIIDIHDYAGREGFGSINLASIEGIENEMLIVTTGGKGAGQVRRIKNMYSGQTWVDINYNWDTVPDSTTTYTIRDSANTYDVTTGTAQGGRGVYNSKLGAATGPTQAQFVDLWSRLAQEFQASSNVHFDLWNEPNDVNIVDLNNAIQDAITEIRTQGFTGYIHVEGLNWAGANTFVSSGWSTYAEALTDSLDKLIFHVHCYFNSDGSGYDGTVSYSGVSLDRLAAVTSWARTNGKKLFLGEFGIANNEDCLAEGRLCLQYMAGNADVWAGWTAWARGVWPESYHFLINGDNRTLLEEFA